MHRWAVIEVTAAAAGVELSWTQKQFLFQLRMHLQLRIHHPVAAISISHEA